MDKPTLHFFGCSFTSLENSDTGHVFNNFRNIVSEKVEYIDEDHSQTGNSKKI